MDVEQETQGLIDRGYTPKQIASFLPFPWKHGEIWEGTFRDLYLNEETDQLVMQFDVRYPNDFGGDPEFYPIPQCDYFRTYHSDDCDRLDTLCLDVGLPEFRSTKRAREHLKGVLESSPIEFRLKFRKMDFPHDMFAAEVHSVTWLEVAR